MSQTVFITVTATVTGSAVPTLNATQLHRLDLSKQTGQIVALSSLGFFGVLAIMLFLCWGILCIRRPRPQPMTRNPDTEEKGGRAFLPIIGRGKRKSQVGLEAVRGGSPANSKQSLVGHAPTTPGGSRRLSMWAAEDALNSTPPIPSPPLLAAHSRSSSSTSDRTVSRYDPHRPHSTASSNSQSTYSVPQPQSRGYVTPYHDSRSMMEVSLEGGDMPRPALPPKIGHVDRATPRLEPARYSFDERRADAVVSPMEDIELGRIRYPQHGNDGRPYDSGMYA